jgi:hypothetical protein
MGNGVPLAHQHQKPYRLFLRQSQCPGDALVLTAALESLHRQYPGEYHVGVETTCQEIWANNPGVKDVPAYQAHIVEMHYPAVNECGRRHVHFMGAFCEYLGRQIGRDVPLLVNRPYLYLSSDEKNNPLEVVGDIGPYCVLNAGHKLDFTAKFGGSGLWQRVVDHFRGRLRFVQVGEDSPHHIHKPLDGVLNLIGKTPKYRDFFKLVQHSVVGAGPVSFLLHVSAALGRPYIALAGGREESTWEAYSTTQYLHTLGQLDCCREKACWRSRTVPLGDGNTNDRSLCRLPVLQDGESVPKCLAMIGHTGVIEALERVLRA